MAAGVAILEACADLLVEVGYRAMTIEAVAARAGVSKATLYRRYKDKEALVTATMVGTAGPPPTEQTLPPGSTRDALAFLARTAARAIGSSAWLPILGAVFSEDPHEGGLASVMRSQILEPSTAIVGRVVHRGIDRGELRPGVTTDVVNNVIHGALISRAILGEEFSDAWVEAMVDAVWAGFGAGTCEPAWTAGPTWSSNPDAASSLT